MLAEGALLGPPTPVLDSGSTPRALPAPAEQRQMLLPMVCHQPCEFRGLLLLIFREDLPLRGGTVVLSTAMIWQTYKMGHKPAGDSWLEILQCLKELHFNN